MGGGYLLAGWHLGAALYLGCFAAATLAACAVLYLWLKKRGGAVLAALQKRSKESDCTSGAMALFACAAQRWLRAWRQIASKLVWLMSCSILHASASAVS